MTEENFEGMPLTAAVKTWMDCEDWTDEIEVRVGRTAATVATAMTIDDQSYRLFIEVSEPDQRLYVYFYTPYNVPRHRMDVMARILNRVNCRLALGRLACDDGPEARAIQFKVSVDVEGSALSLTQVSTMISSGVGTFSDFGGLLAGAALTKRPVEELWLEFLVDEDEEGCSSGCGVARVLN